MTQTTGTIRGTVTQKLSTALETRSPWLADSTTVLPLTFPMRPLELDDVERMYFGACEGGIEDTARRSSSPFPAWNLNYLACSSKYSFMAAAARGQQALIKLLLAHGTESLTVTGNACTAANNAARFGHTTC